MNRRRFLQAGGAAAAASAGALGYGTLVEPAGLDVSEQTLPLGRRVGASGLVFAQISDLHLKGITAQHEKIAAEVARRSPALIVFTGDSVDNTGAVAILNDFLGLLPPALPKFAILGNWEHWGRVDPKTLAASYERANCALLVNRSMTWQVGSAAVRIAGVDDLVGGAPDLPRALGAPFPGGLYVLLAHCPAHRDHLQRRPGTVDLILSGHTHGGQVQAFGFAPFRPPGSGRYRAGWYRGDAPPMYVSRGVGTSVVPVRLGARPELTFFTVTEP